MSSIDIWLSYLGWGFSTSVLGFILGWERGHRQAYRSLRCTVVAARALGMMTIIAPKNGGGVHLTHQPIVANVERKGTLQ